MCWTSSTPTRLPILTNWQALNFCSFLLARSYFFKESVNEQQKGAEHTMSKKPPVGKTLTLAYAAVAAFTAISILVPVLIEKVARKKKNIAE